MSSRLLGSLWLLTAAAVVMAGVGGAAQRADAPGDQPSAPRHGATATVAAEPRTLTAAPSASASDEEGGAPMIGGIVTIGLNIEASRLDADGTVAAGDSGSIPPEATHLRFVALAPQDDSIERVQVAELQAFIGSRVEVDAGSLPPDPAIHDEGQALVASADGQLTLNLMTEGACVFPPPTQGLDAWVTELPGSYADGLHLIQVTPESLVADPRPDIDVYFLSSACQVVGSIASTSASESGTIPQGSKYVVSQLYTTAGARIIVDGSPAQ